MRLPNPVKLFLFFAASCAFLGLTGCGFEAPAPQRSPAPPTPEPPLSTLSATIMVPATTLAGLLNNETQYQIAELKDQPINCGVGHCRLNLTASRTGSASVMAEDGALGIKLPFTIKAGLASSGMFSFLHAQGDGQGIAVAKSSLSISPDLRLHSVTSGSLILNNGHLRLGPIVTNISQLWNDNQASLAPPLWRSVDKRVGTLPLRGRIGAFWAKVFTPLRIGKSPVSWLVLRPEQLSISQPHIKDGAVAITMGIAARGRVIVQDAQPGNSPTALPRAQAMEFPPDTFSFAVPLLLPFDQAARLAMASLSRKPLRFATMMVNFKQLQILPSSRDVVVVAKLCVDPRWDLFSWFASCGTVYLRGKPAFDPVAQAIRIKDLHYDIASANLMLTVTQALAGKALEQILQEHLVFREAKEIDRLKTQIASELATPRGRDLTISGQVRSFGEPLFTWTADGFLAQFSAQGNIKVAVNL
jgi:hypothetical protein